MKLCELTDFHSNRDMQLIAHHNDQKASAKSALMSGIWLVDPKTKKQLAGPFKTEQAATSFKSNRPDRIPASALVITL